MSSASPGSSPRVLRDVDQGVALIVSHRFAVQARSAAACAGILRFGVARGATATVVVQPLLPARERSELRRFLQFRFDELEDLFFRETVLRTKTLESFLLFRPKPAIRNGEG